MPDYSGGFPLTARCFLDTPASHISAWTGPAGPEAARVLRVSAFEAGNDGARNQKCVSGCSLFTSRNITGRI